MFRHFFLSMSLKGERRKLGKTRKKEEMGGRAKHIFYGENGIILCTCYVFFFCQDGWIEGSQTRAMERGALEIALRESKKKSRMMTISIYAVRIRQDTLFSVNVSEVILVS